MLDYYLLLIPIGLIAGLMAGLLGIGGGLVIVPVLMFFYSRYGLFPETIMQTAIGTSLAVIIVTSVASIYGHHKKRSVNWDLVLAFAPGLVVGGVVGAFIVTQVGSVLLKYFFGVFEILIGLQFIMNFKIKLAFQLPGRMGQNIVGLIIGLMSALLGIGGGTMTVPYLAGCQVIVHKAIATSAACGFFIAIASVTMFIAKSAYDTSAMVIDGFAWLMLSLGSVTMAPMGAWLAHQLPVLILKRIFAFLMIGVGIKMIAG